jgi:hypothetical protein
LSYRTGLLALVLAAAGCAGRTSPPAAPTAPVPPPVAPRPAGDPTTLRYATGTGRYRLEALQRTAQEVMGQRTELEMTSVVLLSFAASAEGENLAVVLGVDSIAVTGTTGLPGAGAAEVAAARGRAFRLLLTPGGGFISISLQPPSADSLSPLLQQLFAGLRDLLPGLPEGPIQPGAAWTDTVTVTPPGAPGVSVSVRSVREHRVVGWEDPDGGRALHLATRSTSSVAGSGEQQGQAVELEGSGVSSVDAFVSAAGRLLSQVQTDTTRINVTVVSMGLVVPVTQNARRTLSLVP